MCVRSVSVCVSAVRVCVHIFPPFFFSSCLVFLAVCATTNNKTARQGHGQCHPLRASLSTSPALLLLLLWDRLRRLQSSNNTHSRSSSGGGGSRLRGLSCHLALCSLTTAAAVASSQCRRRARQINLSQSQQRWQHWQQPYGQHWQQTRAGQLVRQAGRHSGHSVRQTRT